MQIDNLYVGKIYEIKETKTPDDYEKNEDVIRFISTVDEYGVLTVNKEQGTTRGEIEVTKEERENYKVTVKVEDEVRAMLKITKKEKDTENKVPYVRYKLTGYNLPETGKSVTTNRNGEVSIKGITIGQEYTLTEIKAPEGYYINQEPITFKLVNNEGTYEIQITNGTIKENSITDSTGKIVINNLYQYVENKDENATYTLKEVLAPDGYAKVKDITFKVQENEGLKFINIDETESKYTTEGNTVKLTIEDSPSFKLIKKDGETGELLSNIKFAIYNVDDGEKPATNSKGEILGTKETINGREYYTVKTDSNGEITADLTEGLYKAVEVQAPDKYDISNSTYYFGIGASREGKKGLQAEWGKGIGGSGFNDVDCIAETQDGCYIIGGCLEWDGTIELEDGTISSNGRQNGIILKLMVKAGVPEIQELDIKNTRKTFKIKTEVKEIDGIKGGNISGEGNLVYEKVKYGDNSTKEIIIAPNKDYEIIQITINRERHDFIANEDGTYKMPQFENMLEDKYIIVTFAMKDNKITINNVDKITKELLKGAKFRIEEIDYRTNPESVIREIVASEDEYVDIDKTNEIQGILGELSHQGEYGFIKQDERYEANNQEKENTI